MNEDVEAQKKCSQSMIDSKLEITQKLKCEREAMHDDEKCKKKRQWI